jgi:hypothetical protein
VKPHKLRQRPSGQVYSGAADEPLGATSIATVSSGEAWAVGAFYAVSLHLTGGIWQPLQVGQHPSLSAVSVVSASEG